MGLLTNIRPPRYLRYFFYVIYMWYQNHDSEKDDAHWTAVMFLTFPHSLVTIFFIPWFFFDKYVDLQKIHISIFFMLILGLHYFMFIYKTKWINYVKEFEYLNKKQTRRGTFYVLFYLVFLLFLTALPILVGELLDK